MARYLYPLRLGLASYLSALLVLSYCENWLIFPAPRYPEGDWDPLLPREDVSFASADGVPLHGWFLDHPQPRAHVLFLHGNGDHLGFLAPYLRELRERQQVAIFAFDYRGYGRSGGTPSEAGVLADGLAAQDWLARRAGLRPDELVLMGRSLGGAVAVDLAARQGARGLVLQSTFTSLPAVASLLYWWAPVRWLMQTQFNSLEKIRRYAGPVLVSHGTADTLVSCQFGRELCAAAPGPKTFVELPGLGHNDPDPPAFTDALDRFLAELPPLAERP